MAQLVMAHVSEAVKEINKNLTISYYDTGLPSTSDAYTTYLLIHGFVHNKNTWLPTLNSIPPATRVIAPNLRGYTGSSDWVDPDKLSGAELLDQLAHDYVDIITWVTEEIADNQHGESRLVVLGWSLGNLGIVSGYQLLAAGELDEVQRQILSSRIERVVFYEPPSKPVFSNPHDATTAYHQGQIGKYSGEARLQKLLEYLSGVMHFDSTGFDDWVSADSRYATEVFEIQTNLCHDPSFRPTHLDKVLEFGSLETYARMIAGPDEDQTQNAKAIAGVGAMVNAPGIDVIQGLFCTTTLAECIHGSVWIVQQVQSIEDDKQRKLEVGSTKSKAVIDSVDKPCGHYIHALVPDLFWQKVSREYKT